jgi:polysaccharide biosynthesis protein PslH
MKIFFLLPRIPYPLEKGDKLRAFNQLKYLAIDNEVHLCALFESSIHPDAYAALKPYCKTLHFLKLPVTKRICNVFFTLFNGKPFQVGYFFNNSNFKKINSLLDEIQPDRIYCQLIRVAEYVKLRNFKKTIDYQDVFSKGVERRIATSSIPMKVILKSEHKRLLAYERDVFEFFDTKTIISYPDRNLIPHPDKNNIVVIPNGVDMQYYKPLEIKKEYDLLFTGNMGYPPNIESAIFIVKKILPLVREKFPHIKVMIAGVNPSARVLALKSDNVMVTGWVEDMRICYAKARIFIAPMHLGTGLQNKLLEAMAMKLPCITSELANSALGALNGEEILTGTSAKDFANHISILLNDGQKLKSLSEQGYNFVKEKYNWDAVNEKLNQVICG